MASHNITAELLLFGLLRLNMWKQTGDVTVTGIFACQPTEASHPQPTTTAIKAQKSKPLHHTHDELVFSSRFIYYDFCNTPTPRSLNLVNIGWLMLEHLLIVDDLWWPPTHKRDFDHVNAASRNVPMFFDKEIWLARRKNT